ncbi:hypothetical protein ASPVEDRAFT_152810 [Aspergillus versicolor CBS 583.65]|uniref:Major facilitator superfamily (MFS) profile domain-containing protein n=1 Tax=Aspergillus versicolor CBS 583.65 TaxID=1036611 RepID=A0A1L9PSF8_ASPVE|nr:uncharacterized protein ASPVEDRAFT_152810 [Aspergillus versicolor CBS 583.65]OJJ04457.1 hypothetical protein ASPVEDRAFT_152810 [Aspergillus versicolor CBS 583.65]
MGYIMQHFDVSEEVATLGLSLFVIGFSLGPVIWAPLSESISRQIPFFISFLVMAAFCAGCAGAQNIQTLLILRFFAGTFGSSPLTNAGGIVSDMFTSQRIRTVLNHQKHAFPIYTVRTHNPHRAILVRVDKSPLSPLDSQYRIPRPLRIRACDCVSGDRELPCRLVYGICGVCSGQYVCGAVYVWWRVPAFHELYVQGVGDSASSIPAFVAVACIPLPFGIHVFGERIRGRCRYANFLYFNIYYAEQLYASQLVHHSPGIYNQVEYRALEGFTYTVSPFNFTTIAGNLAALPALLGNMIL